MADYEGLLNEANNFIQETNAKAKMARNLNRIITPKWSSIYQTEIRIKNAYRRIARLESEMEKLIKLFAA